MATDAVQHLKAPPVLVHGVRCWNESDTLRVDRLAEREGADVVVKVSGQLQLASGKMPLPSDVENYFARMAARTSASKRA